jgi:hypothetical protein
MQESELILMGLSESVSGFAKDVKVSVLPIIPLTTNLYRYSQEEEERTKKNDIEARQIRSLPIGKFNSVCSKIKGQIRMQITTDWFGWASGC